MGERQIHVVAAKQNVFADADPLQFQDSLDIRDRDQAKVGCPATDVTDQYDIAGSDQVAPCSARLRRPGVECRLWLLQEPFGNSSECGTYRADAIVGISASCLGPRICVTSTILV
jgi:hypothetical protein